MRRKILFGFDYTDSETIKLLLYLFVGGTAALFEWGLFYLLLHFVVNGFGWPLAQQTMIATAVAFSLSTLFHYFLGNILVFDSGSRYQRGTELGLVFLVSSIGLLWNLVLMYIFVSVLSWEPMLSKVLTSCIVVVWNYLSRKKWIFRS